MAIRASLKGQIAVRFSSWVHRQSVQESVQISLKHPSRPTARQEPLKLLIGVRIPGRVLYAIANITPGKWVVLYIIAYKMVFEAFR